MEEDLVKNADLQKIADEGEKIYESVKAKYEPQENGKFLAIEIESKDVFFGEHSKDAVDLAKHKHSDKVFYVVKIGFGVTETLAKYSHKR